MDPQHPRCIAHFHRAQQHPVQRDEHRDLNQHGQAAAQRVDLFFLVQLHHGNLHLLLVVAKALLERSKARGQLLHPRHRLEAGRRQGIKGNLDQDGEHHDGPAPVAHHTLEEHQQPEQRLGNGIEPAVINHAVQPGGQHFEHLLVLRAGIERSVLRSLGARSEAAQRLYGSNGKQAVADRARIEITLRIAGGDPGREEIVLNHRHPTVVGRLGLECILLGDIVKRNLVEMLGIGIERRARIGLVERGFVANLAVVASDLQIQAG